GHALRVAAGVMDAESGDDEKCNYGSGPVEGVVDGESYQARLRLQVRPDMTEHHPEREDEAYGVETAYPTPSYSDSVRHDDWPQRLGDGVERGIGRSGSTADMRPKSTTWETVRN